MGCTERSPLTSLETALLNRGLSVSEATGTDAILLRSFAQPLAHHGGRWYEILSDDLANALQQFFVFRTRGFCYRRIQLAGDCGLPREGSLRNLDRIDASGHAHPGRSFATPHRHESYRNYRENQDTGGGEQNKLAILVEECRPCRILRLRFARRGYRAWRNRGEGRFERQAFHDQLIAALCAETRHTRNQVFDRL